MSDTQNRINFLEREIKRIEGGYMPISVLHETKEDHIAYLSGIILRLKLQNDSKNIPGEAVPGQEMQSFEKMASPDLRNKSFKMQSIGVF